MPLPPPPLQLPQLPPLLLPLLPPSPSLCGCVEPFSPLLALLLPWLRGWRSACVCAFPCIAGGICPARLGATTQQWDVRSSVDVLSRNAVAASPGCAGPEADDGRAWQPYTDFLVYSALLALPWGGAELAESVPDELGALLSAVDAYMARRPRAAQPSLRPFAAAIKDDDAVAE